MSTKTETKTQGAEHQHHEIVDEQTGVYGWFRRNQKKLLYSVGLFVLVTFSVSGPMLAAVADWFEPTREMPTIEVGGKRVPLEARDYQVGRAIASRAGVLSSVLPTINVGEGGSSEGEEVYAILRRAAIEEGIDVSFIEVDRAVAAMMSRGSVKSEMQLAQQYRFGSLADFQQIVAEAMRIGTMVQLQTLALDNSEARILERVIGDKEKVSFKVASFDQSARAEELKEAGSLTFDDLKKWLDEKELPDQQRLGVFDTNRVALTLGALMEAEFDRAEWAEYLEGFELGDEELQKLYNMMKPRFENEDGTFKEFEDEGVKDEITRLRESQEVLTKILAKIKEKQSEVAKPARDAFSTANQDFLAAQNQLAVAKQKAEANPEDEAAKGEVVQAEQKVAQYERLKEEAQTAMSAANANLDFAAEFAELTKGETGPKKGVVQRAFADKRTQEQLKDLESGDLGLGDWEQSQIATYISGKGDLSFSPAWTSKATIIYQVSDVDVRPLKKQEDLEPILKDAYFNEKAQDEADEKKKKIEEALLRLAKAKMPDKVLEIEKKRVDRVDEQMAEWETGLKQDIANAESKVAETRPGSVARAEWEKKLAELKSRLDAKDARREEVETEIDDAIKAEIDEEAAKFHTDVLDEAAAEAGFEVQDIGPLPRDLQSRPRFDKKHDHTTVFLYRNHAESEKGDSTGLLEDFTNKRYHVAVCTDVMPLDRSDVERREFELVRKGYFNRSFASTQAGAAFSQAFTKDALEQRYKVERPAGQQTELQPEPGGGEQGTGEQGSGESGSDPNKNK